MAIKFIGNSRKDFNVGDEIVIRCSCGCGFLTVSSFIDIDFETNQKTPLLAFSHFDAFISDKKRADAQEMVFANPEFIFAIANLINKEAGCGQGVVQDENNGMMMISRDEDDSLCIAGFYDEKCFKKYMKNPAKNIKYLAWNIMLEKKESDKFAGALDKILREVFSDEVCEKDRDGSYNEEVKND